MRKKIAMLSSLFLAMIVSMAVISSVRAEIRSIDWMGPVFLIKYDVFYDEWVVAYETGTDWSLSVLLRGRVDGMPLVVNVSRITVWFDWGLNYTYTYAYPLPQVPKNEQRAFTISNTTAPISMASNMFPHEYMVYVEYAKNTSTRELAGTPFSYSWASFGYKFAVYSSDQKAAMSSEDRYNDIYSTYSSGYFTSAVAASLRSQAILEDSRGDDYYDIGDFANAKTSYAAAVSKFEQAIAAQESYGGALQEASLNNTIASGNAMSTSANADMKQADAALVEANAAMVTANATMTQAEAALTNAYGWYFIGIGFAVGWTLMGVGVVVYALRKPKTIT